MARSLTYLVLCLSFAAVTGQAAEIFSTNATWRLLRGRSEASSPDVTAWRYLVFNDSAFSNAPAPFTYGEPAFTLGTMLNDMQNQYTCIFLRRAIELTNISEIGALRVGARVDDGFILWINGTEVLRVQVSGAPGSPVTYTTLANGAPSEPVPFLFYNLTSPGSYLTLGSNSIAVQVFNVSTNSSDLVFDCSLDSILVETNPPTVALVTPVPGDLTNLTQITVKFSEPVNGVNASDLILNTVSATGVSGSGDTYTFTFPQPAYGVVYVTWAGGHGITDGAFPPNAFNGSAPGATWQYNLMDTVPPQVVGILPAPATTVRALGEIRVTFDEGVTGVDPADLRMNNQSATNLISLPGSVYVFQFPAAVPGGVLVQWVGNHGITDLSPMANPFGSGSWSYTVDPNATLGDLVITEMLAANISGLSDPVALPLDPEPLPWIEILNRGSSSIDLHGWSLTDDASEPRRWVFPSKVIGPGQYVIVFASGLNIINAPGTNRFHTNFKLSRNGEFLGLYSPDSPPALISGFSPSYPEQRNDYSYGPDTFGNLRYFATPTPGGPNGNSSISGVTAPVHFNVARGHFTQPFDLVLTCPTPGAQIRYTVNAREPTLTSGFSYVTPLRITNLAMIRATAFRTNLLPSSVATHTYLFNLSAAQRSLPILSIVTDQDNLTGPNGIIGISNVTQLGDGRFVPADATGYHNPSLHGVAWERPTSVEYIRPLDNSGFQADCGIRVQGSDYQRPRTTPTSKFSFRLYFRGVYGSGRLRFPLFPLAASEEFDQIVVRAGFNDPTDPFIRDEVTRRISHDMGQVAAHGTLVNLFLNGVYRLYYNPTERVHEEFLRSYLGGSENWDVVGPSFATGAGVPGVIDGDRNSFQSLVSYVNSANVNDPATYTEIGRRLDLTNFADYCLLNAYTAMGDWPQNNWRAGKDRAADPFRFIVWDAEWAMGIYGRGVTSNIFTMGGPGPNEGGLASTSDSEIAQLYQRLYLSPEFRLHWADRVHKHMFNRGALTDENITNRYYQLRSEMAGVLPNMALDIPNTWVAQRRAILFSQMNTQALIASSNAPFFNQFGGRVAPGFNLTMVATNGGGTIYYTTNGADPRVAFSGMVSSDALSYGSPVPINRNTLIRARTLNGASWSALAEASYSTALLGTPIRFTEIYYNPVDSSAYEFMELMNVGGAPVDLSGMSFDGVSFTFNVGTILAPGARLVLASDLAPASFAARYPGVSVAGYFAGGLNNGGERLALLDTAGNVVTSLDYDDAGGWPLAADGSGASLEIVDPLGDPDDPTNWRASTVGGGTPGTSSAPPPLGDVRLNEVLAENTNAVNHVGTFPDFVELFNAGGSPVNLEGWSLTDDGDARKFVLPPGTMIGAGGYLVIWCDAATNTTPGLHSGFAFGRNGDNVYLYDSSTNLVDALTFGLQLANRSVGRVAGAWTLTTPTTNAANVAASLGAATSLSINEFLANPLSGESDWVELFNASSLPVALRGVFLATTTAVHQVTSLSFVGPFGFAQLFADENVGPDRLDFRLPAAGGTIILYDATGAEVNRLPYTAQTEGVSRGRLPDGNANIVNFPGTASPGASNYVAAYTGPVINEILARNVSVVTNAGRVADYVELYNTNATTVSVAGMSLSVNAAEPRQFVFPPGTTVAGRGFLVVWCDGNQPASTNAGNFNTGRALQGESGGAYLFNTAGQLVNSVDYGFQVADRAIGLVTNVWRLVATATPGASNSPPATLGAATALRFNEWMAQPGSGPDWFELVNTTNQPVDMTGVFLTDDPSTAGTNEFRVPALSFIGPGSFVQWLADSQPEQGRNHVNFDLDAKGETLRLYSSNTTGIIDSIAFGAQRLAVSQGRLPDGSSNITVFPGSATPAAPNYRLIPEVVINELLTHSSAPFEDAIELYNPAAAAAPVGGWFLSDTVATPKKFRIPDGTMIPGGGFVVFYEAQFNSGGSNSFALDRARGGEVWLSSADGSGNLNGERTVARYGPAAAGVSFGRYAASLGVEYAAMSGRTFGMDAPATVEQFRSGTGAANTGPLVGPVVLNELMYHPPEEVAGAAEFIELRNVSGTPVDLFDPARPTNRWRLAGGVDFTLPATTLGVGASLLIVEFDPVADPGSETAFRNYYGVPLEVPVLGPYSGKLDNAGETIELLKPDLPDGNYIPLVLVDRVAYADSPPWPSGGVDGGGLSLQRRSGNAFGNDPANWIAAAPTAGSANSSGVVAPPVITLPPGAVDAPLNSDVLLQVTATGEAPLTYQWRFNGVELPGETNATLSLDYLQLEDDGTYDVYASNPGGSVFSAGARVTVLAPPAFVVRPPAFATANFGSNITFSAVVVGSAPLRYQWRHNGTNLPGANGPALVLTSLTLPQSGIYSLEVTNAYGSASAAVEFYVLLRPSYIQHPLPTMAFLGGTAVFTVATYGTEPMSYRWRRITSTFSNGIVLSTPTNSTLIVTNVTLTDHTNFNVIVTNLAGQAIPAASSNAFLTVLIDTDGDGLPNNWEDTHPGFDRNNPDDGRMDSDLDGMSDSEEFGAGTDYLDPQSFLRVSIAPASGAWVSFGAQSNRTYTVQFSDGISSPQWQRLANVLARAVPRTELLFDPSPGTNRYYRVVTPLQP